MRGKAVVGGGKARKRTVQVGHSNGVETEVLAGLDAGDQVVVYPGDKIADGVRVSAIAVSDR